MTGRHRDHEVRTDNLFWTAQANPGAVGLITGQESDHQKAMRYLREQGEARAAAARSGIPSTWGAGKAKALPGGMGAGDGYASSFEVDGGALHDFLRGKDRRTTMLPGFGSRSPLRLPDSATEGLKDQAAEAGTAAGESTATEIGAALASKAGEIVEKAKGVFESVQSVFAAGISMPVRAAPRCCFEGRRSSRSQRPAVSGSTTIEASNVVSRSATSYRQCRRRCLAVRQ